MNIKLTDLTVVHFAKTPCPRECGTELLFQIEDGPPECVSVVEYLNGPGPRFLEAECGACALLWKLMPLLGWEYKIQCVGSVEHETVEASKAPAEQLM